MITLYDLLPDASAVLALEPGELAGLVLELFHADGIEEHKRAHLSHLTHLDTLGFFQPSDSNSIIFALAEAWNWLIKEGMIAALPGDQHGWHFVTRRGTQLKNRSGLNEYRRALLLPRSILHPKILEACWPCYFRGEYDTAVFKAFRELEIEIRDAGQFSSESVGTAMVRKAFGENGPLSDKTALPAEREALSGLMAGAFGSYRNPHSHRKVTVDAEEAAEILVLASHLLKIVDKRWLSTVLG